jgi:hypothetical protein
MPQEGRRDRSWLSPHTVLILCFGILVPIVAALVPLVRGLLKAHDFRYSISGPISVGKHIAFAITVMNRGRETENDVQVWIPYDQGMSEFQYELSWAPPGTRVRDASGYRIFTIGDLKPEQIARISIMTKTPTGPVNLGNTKDEQFVPSMAPRIASSHGEAQWVPATRRASRMRYVYETGFWGFIIIVVTVLLWAMTTSRVAQRLLGRI